MNTINTNLIFLLAFIASCGNRTASFTGSSNQARANKKSENIAKTTSPSVVKLPFTKLLITPKTAELELGKIVTFTAEASGEGVDKQIVTNENKSV